MTVQLSVPLDPIGALRPSASVHVIRDDREALAVAAEVAAYLETNAAARDRDRILPTEELRFVRDRGLGAITVGKAHGGAGVSFRTLTEVAAIIAGADASIAQVMLNDFYIPVSFRVNGTAEQKADIAALSLAGHGFGNATSEVGTKQSNQFRTTIRRRGDRYVVNGEKFYTTGSLLAHYVSVTGLDDDGAVATALVSRNAPGVSIADDWDGFGQRTTASGTMAFADVEVEPLRVVHARNVNASAPFGTVAQLVHSAIDLGIAQAAHRATLDYVRTKTRPWRNTGLENGYDDPYIIAGVGEHETRIHAAEAMLARGADLVEVAMADPSPDAMTRAAVAVAEAKILTTEVALQVPNRLFQFAGARATGRAFGFDRYLRDGRVHTAHDPLHWKFHLIGNYTLNGRLPPRDGSV
ncbi:MAG: SfnB family sulfur acquisition oxidoreductase [Rhizobium sp.]